MSTRTRKAALVGRFVIAGSFAICSCCRALLQGRRALAYREFGKAGWSYECAPSCDQPAELTVGRPS